MEPSNASRREPATEVAEPLVRADGVWVRFGALDVLRDASVEIRRGEVVGLIGENGAGKSTLAKTIGGVNVPRQGAIIVGGRPAAFRSPRDAIRQGVALIHQEPLTFPDLTVAENIFLGRQPRRWGMIDWRTMNREAARLLGILGANIDPKRRVRGLSIADQHMIEMAAALSHRANVFLMDETTAALTPSEAETLLRVMRQLRDAGAGLAFISHRMEEVFSICNRVVILRDGQVVGQREVAKTNVDEVLRLMVGRPRSEMYARVETNVPGKELLEVRGLGRRQKFSDVNFVVRAGEVVGIAGLVGSGRTSLARALFGLLPVDAGQILIEGRERRIRSPRQAIAQGLALVPEDRQHHGVLMPMNLWQNTTMTITGRLSRLGWLRDGTARRLTADHATRLNVKYARLDQPIRELSGGNQQKLVLGKWLMTRPNVILLDEPTRGVDIGAKAEVHRVISELAAGGMGVLLISSDLPEVLAMSDRVLVMREGRLVKEFSRGRASAERVIAAATGQSMETAEATVVGVGPDRNGAGA
jgi:rhamnose transport system ATP-binding protein